MQLNEIQIAGYVGRDANHRPGEVAVTNFSLCQTEKYKEKEFSTWVDVTVFGKMADICSTVKKGDNVFVKGRLRVETFTSKKDGTEKTAIKVLASQVSKLAYFDSASTDQTDAPPAQSADPSLDEIPF